MSEPSGWLTVMLPLWVQLECSHLTDMKSLFKHCRRGKACLLVMGVLGHEVGKDLGITVAFCPDELILLSIC